MHGQNLGTGLSGNNHYALKMFYISGKSRLTTAKYSDILKEIIFSPKAWSQETWIQIPTAPLVSYWSYQAFYPSVSFCKMRIIIVSTLVAVSIEWNNVYKILT